MSKTEIQKIYNAVRNNEAITSGEKLAAYLDMPGNEVSKIMRNYSHIRERVNDNRIKSGAGRFNRIMAMWRPAPTKTQTLQTL